MGDMTRLGQIFSFIGALFIVASIFSKNKKNMITLQLCTTSICVITTILLHGYSGTVANILNSTRHILEIKGKLTRNNTIAIAVILVVSGLWLNTSGIFGLFAITAATTYIIFAYIIHSVQGMRLLLIASTLQWAFFDFYIKSYPIFVLDCVIIITSLVKYISVKKEESKQDLSLN